MGNCCYEPDNIPQLKDVSNFMKGNFIFFINSFVICWRSLLMEIAGYQHDNIPQLEDVSNFMKYD